jgi:hypothetical protein
MLSEESRLEKDRLAVLAEEAVTIRQRVVNRVHSALMHGDLVAQEHRSDGEIVPIPAAWWRRDGIENEFQNARDYRSPFTGIVFLDVVALDQLFALDSTAQTAAGEDRLVDRLTNMMRAAPTAPRSKAEVAEELRGQPGIEVSDRGFVRAWNTAVKRSGATTWSAPGRKRSKRRIETPT